MESWIPSVGLVMWFSFLILPSRTAEISLKQYLERGFFVFYFFSPYYAMLWTYLAWPRWLKRETVEKKTRPRKQSAPRPISSQQTTIWPQLPEKTWDQPSLAQISGFISSPVVLCHYVLGRSINSNSWENYHRCLSAVLWKRGFILHLLLFH